MIRSPAVAGNTGDRTMDFFEWCQANGLNPENLSEDVHEAVRARWRADLRDGAQRVPFAEAVAVHDAREAVIARWPAERGCHPERLAATAAAARAARLEPRETDLALMRASRFNGRLPFSPTGGAPSHVDALAAGLIVQQGVSLDRVAEWYTPAVADAATTPQYRNMSLHGLFRECLASHGRHVPTGRLGIGAIREVFDLHREARADAGPSTLSVSGILADAANKLLLATYLDSAMTWPRWCKIGNAPDFKVLNRYRLTGDSTFDELAPGGTIPHGTLEDATFTNQAKSYGKVLGIDRTQVINDDMSAFANVPKILSRAAALKQEKVAYTLLLSNPGSPAFFSTNHGNFLSGGTGALALGGMKLAFQRFMAQTDSSGSPTMLIPRILLHPPLLYPDARAIVNSELVIAGTASATQPSGNAFVNSLDPVTAPYLGVAGGLVGASDTGWYVMVGPGDFSPVEMAFLDGVVSPQVETSVMEFDRLGIALRIVADFGAGLMDYRGADFSAGA